jgi:hypothetical protein
MAIDIDDLACKALSLPAESRAKLADMLVESLDGGGTRTNRFRVDRGSQAASWRSAVRSVDRCRPGRFAAGTQRHQAMRFEFHTDALLEYKEAAQYYAARDPAVGIRFVEAAEDARSPVAQPIRRLQPGGKIPISLPRLGN